MGRGNKCLTILLPAAGLFFFWFPVVMAFNFGDSSEGNAKCFLSGTIRSVNAESRKKSFQSLENHIRLSFDAKDPFTCERYIKSYCQNNLLLRGDKPVKLSGYFRPSRVIASDEDKKPTHTYQVSEDCHLVIE